MNIDKILSKLEPLMPEKVGHWKRVRACADPKLKSLIEKHIVNQAYEILGDFHNKILLSLPSDKFSSGALRLGTIVYEKDKWGFGISPNELMQNLAIFGRSGAGKSNIAYVLIEQLVNRKIPFLFLDHKRTARHLIPRLKGRIRVYTPGRSLMPFYFNPFLPPPGYEKSVYVNQIIDVMAEAYILGEGNKSILQKAILRCYEKNDSPTAAEVLQEVENIPGKGRVLEWKISVRRALESMIASQLTCIDKMSQEKMAHNLLSQNTILELDGLSQSSKKFLVPLLCLWMYSVELANQNREKLKLVLFVEESHHFFYRRENKSKESLMNMLLRQCRELGISMVLIDQHPSLISRAVGNCYTSIVMNLKNIEDINKAAGMSLVEEDDKRYFSQLAVGYGIVKMQDRWQYPFLVKFPLAGIQKGLVTDEILKALQLKNAGSGSKTLEKLKFEQVPQVPTPDILDEKTLGLIDDIVAYPDDGIKERYFRLGLSAGTGNRLKSQLLSEGWIQSEIISLGNTRKLLLRLTPQARKMLNLDTKKERESLKHEYWKNYYAHILQDKGYKVKIECPRNSGRVDVLAEKEHETIAIEIETGKSDIMQNIRNNLLSGFQQIWVVATDETALKKVEQELGKAGVLGLPKIKVIVRDQIPEKLP